MASFSRAVAIIVAVELVIPGRAWAQVAPAETAAPGALPPLPAAPPPAPSPATATPTPTPTATPTPTSSPPTSPPPPPSVVGNDVVIVKGGGMLRGVLVEIRPEDHVTILVAGQPVAVPWAVIERIDRGTSTTSPSNPAAPPAPFASSPPPINGPTVIVHVDCPRPIQLLRRNPDDGIWLTACDSPCDLALPLDNEYRVGGGGSFQSGEFRLDARGGQRVVLHVNPSTYAGFTAPMVVAGVGLLTAIVGIYVGYIAVLGQVASDGSGDNGAGKLAIGLILGGAAVMAGGGVVALANSTTGVTQEAGAAGAPSARPGPEWRARDTMDRTSAPGITLFTTRF